MPTAIKTLFWLAVIAFISFAAYVLVVGIGKILIIAVTVAACAYAWFAAVAKTNRSLKAHSRRQRR